MKVFCDLMARKIVGNLHENFQEMFPIGKVKKGIASVRDVTEVMVCENVFSSKQLVLCEHVPPQVDHYLIHLVFEEKNHMVRSQKVYPKDAKVEIEYVQKIWSIEIVKIHRKV